MITKLRRTHSNHLLDRIAIQSWCCGNELACEHFLRPKLPMSIGDICLVAQTVPIRPVAYQWQQAIHSGMEISVASQYSEAAICKGVVGSYSVQCVAKLISF